MVNVQVVLHGIPQLMLATGLPLLTAVMEIDHAYKSDCLWRHYWRQLYELMIVMLQTAEDTIVTFRLYIHKTSFLLSGNNKDHIESLKSWSMIHGRFCK